MSVYTSVDSVQLNEFLTRYDLGKAISLEGITAGITNSNYYLDTEAGRFVLTLYEYHNDTELDYILGLQRHLAAKSIACASPVSDLGGRLYSSLNQRPAAIINRVPGEVIARPSLAQCRQIGCEMARFHVAGADFNLQRPNPRGSDWWYQTRDQVKSKLNTADILLLDTTLREFERFDYRSLPGGAIHADLFHDNSLFRGSALGGIIDFDYACSDSYAFDIAVTLNDWAIDSQGALDTSRVNALLCGYLPVRRLLNLELDTLPLMLRIAALRFWLSRLHDRTFPLSGELTYCKDPDEFRQMLELRSSDNSALFLPHYQG